MRLLTIPFPKIDPVAFSLGPVSVRWYGLAYMAGLLLGWLYIKWLLREEHLWPGGKSPFGAEGSDDLLVFVTLGVVVGGRLGHVLLYEPAYYLRHPLEVFAIWRGGMAFHGGLAGAVAGAILFAHRAGANVWSVLDATAAATPMGLLFGRLANFINAEVVGRPTTEPWAMVFPGAGPEGRHPSQLYEAFLEGAVLFALLFWLIRSKLALRRPGMIGGIFLVGYGLARSFCEFFREPDADHLLNVGPLTAGIIYSLPMIAAGIWIMREAGRRTPAPADAQRSS